MTENQTPFADESSVVSAQRFWGMEANSYCLLMHLSQFANGILPMAV